MGPVNFRRHWLLLGVAAIPVLLAGSLPDSGYLPRFEFIFALIGALHALALVASLRVGVAWYWWVAFVLIAAGLSYLAPIVGVSVGIFVGGVGDLSFYLSIMLSSVIGASTYWLVIRWGLIGNLRYFSLVLAVIFCGLYSPIAVFGGSAITNFGQYNDGVLQMIAGAVPTIGWWYLFSLALYLDVGLEGANKSLKADAVNGAA